MIRRPSLFYTTPVATKVPQITLMFWAIKLLTTGMGEACSDWLGQISVPLGAALGLIGIVLAMWWQFRTPRYRPVPYWTAVSMVAIVGTMVADGMHANGLPFPVTSACYLLLVIVVFAYWYRREGDLDIHNITTTSREVCYWLAVMATFTLGTAVGDLTASTFGLGYRLCVLIFAGLMLLPLIGWGMGLNQVVIFWLAYLLTRPLGASIADMLDKSGSGGFALGNGMITLLSVALIVVLVATIARRRPVAIDPEPELAEARE